MTTDNSKSVPTAPTVQARLFDQDVELFDEELEDALTAEDLASIDLEELLGYEEVPILLVDTDPERAVARQKEMMDACFGGIGEEKKPEKRMGLGMCASGGVIDCV